MTTTMKKVAVVGGCGHVGLPLSLALSPHHQVFIYDTDAAAVERVKRGEMPFKDDGGEEALRRALDRGLQLSTTPEALSQCDYIIIVIGTPVDEHLNPSFNLFDKVLSQLFELMQPGQTLVLRSTVYPGTTERVYQQLKKRGLDVEVTFCPERVAEGVALKEIQSLPQIISGFSEQGVQAVRELFGPIGADLIELAPLEAELTKLFNNVYRYITFAVANQFYMVASQYGLDFYKILHAMKHKYPRASHMPAAGFAAGPCLFKDTMQMSAFNDNQFFLGHSAMLVNEGLPQFVVQRMHKRWPDMQKLTVGILGMAFKSESDDARESLSYKLRKILELNAGAVLACDPYVKDAGLKAEAEVLEKADVLVIGTPHKRYKDLDYGGKPVVDIWNLLGHGGVI
jgi:UDP-N-acetyl-D-mannosaminuronic acid dehydrogenase